MVQSIALGSRFNLVRPSKTCLFVTAPYIRKMLASTSGYGLRIHETAGLDELRPSKAVQVSGLKLCLESQQPSCGGWWQERFNTFSTDK